MSATCPTGTVVTTSRVAASRSSGFNRLEVVECLGDLRRILAVRIRGSRPQPFDEHLGRCAEQHDVVEKRIEHNLIATAGNAMDALASKGISIRAGSSMPCS
jgi:hypothetical protein